MNKRFENNKEAIKAESEDQAKNLMKVADKYLSSNLENVKEIMKEMKANYISIKLSEVNNEDYTLIIRQTLPYILFNDLNREEMVVFGKSKNVLPYIELLQNSNLLGLCVHKLAFINHKRSLEIGKMLDGEINKLDISSKMHSIIEADRNVQLLEKMKESQVELKKKQETKNPNSKLDGIRNDDSKNNNKVYFVNKVSSNEPSQKRPTTPCR